MKKKRKFQCRRRRTWYLLWIALIPAIGCGYLRKPEQNRKALRGLETVRSFGVVYSKEDIHSFQPFDLVILESGNYSREEIMTLRTQNKIVLAYVNIGELETFRSYARDVPDDWLLGPNPNWEHHYFINPKKKGWLDLLRRKVIPAVLAKGFQGFLFDSVDMASPYRYPTYKPAMAHLIQTLHQTFPNAYIVLNNAEFLLKDVVNQVHGLMVEEILTHRHNNRKVILRKAPEVATAIGRLAEIHQRWRLPIFILEYFPDRGSLPYEEMKHIQDRYHLLWYVTDADIRDVHQDRLHLRKAEMN